MLTAVQCIRAGGKHNVRIYCTELYQYKDIADVGVI